MKTVTATNYEDMHDIVVSKDDDETFLTVDIRRNPRIAIHPAMRVHPTFIALTWVEATLLRNALDELINDKD